MTQISQTYKALESCLGYTFQDHNLVRQALSHASALDHNDPTKNYERLEFLGDRVLGLCVADILFTLYPLDSEGDLAKRHAQLVSSETLITIAKTWNLGDMIAAERKNFAHNRPSVMADVVESLLATIYKESGLEGARPIIERFWLPLAQTMSTVPTDPKSALQEWTHQNGIGFPQYDLVRRQGPDHKPLFDVKVTVRTKQKSNITCTGTGSSRRRAESNAALAALTHITDHNL